MNAQKWTKPQMIETLSNKSWNNFYIWIARKIINAPLLFTEWMLKFPTIYISHDKIHSQNLHWFLDSFPCKSCHCTSGILRVLSSVCISDEGCSYWMVLGLHQHCFLLSTCIGIKVFQVISFKYMILKRNTFNSYIHIFLLLRWEEVCTSTFG